MEGFLQTPFVTVAFFYIIAVPTGTNSASYLGSVSTGWRGLIKNTLQEQPCGPRTGAASPFQGSAPHSDPFITSLSQVQCWLGRFPVWAGANPLKLFQYRSPDSTRFPVTFPPFNTSSVVPSLANDKHREVWSRGHLITRCLWCHWSALIGTDLQKRSDTLCTHSYLRGIFIGKLHLGRFFLSCIYVLNFPILLRSVLKCCQTTWIGAFCFTNTAW